MKNRNAKFVSFVFVFVYFFLCPLIAEGSPTRGFWMWGSTLNSGNIQSTVNKLSDNYVNEVYLLVKGTAGTKSNATTITNFINSEVIITFFAFIALSFFDNTTFYIFIGITVWAAGNFHNYIIFA